MIIEPISFTQTPEKFGLVAEFCKLRKYQFSDTMQWSLDIFNEFEYDQYDGAHTTYILAHEKGEVHAGCRLLPTNRNSPIHQDYQYTYMINDAHRGLLDRIPSSLCDEQPPISDTCWELTRLVSKNKGTASHVISKAMEYLASKNVHNCLYLGSPAFIRYARKLGYKTEAIGPVLGNNSGRFQVISCEVQNV